jgi:hypothetical protein
VWTQQDPMMWEGFTSPYFLQNPQFQNSYSYAGNNPTTYWDADGRKVELVARKVITQKDAHLFFKVTPDNPEEINIQGVPNGMKEFTIGAYNEGSKIERFTGFGNTLTPRFGYEGSQYNSDLDYLSGAETPTATVIITPPGRISDTEFINSLGASANNVQPTSYFMFGNLSKQVKNANSNNFVNQVGSSAGVGDQIRDFSVKGVWIPGKNSGVPKTSIVDTVKSTYKTTVNKASSFIKSLRN